MGTLKGQNFRIYSYDDTAEKYKVVAMATSCTVTLTNNTEESSHKDITGMSSTPVVTSKGWQVQVESLNMADIGAILTAIKNQTVFKLRWDESAPANNQGQKHAAYARGGDAYLTDASFTFDDRSNATKSLQFSGIGAIANQGASPATEVVPVSTNYTKGQFVRFFLGNDNTAAPIKVIAAAKSLSLHVSVSLEESATKDTEGEWSVQEPTGISYDISTSALVKGGDTITSTVEAQDISSIESIYEAGTPVKFKIANVSGDNNRTASSTIVSGSVVLTSLTLNGPNRQNADYTAQFNGFGDYTVGS